MRRFVCAIVAVLLATGVIQAGEKKTRILLIGKDRDHAFSTHEYMADCEILAKCLRQTPGVEAVVSNGWPKNAEVLKDVKAIVLHTRMGGNVLFDPLIRDRVEKMLQNGVGLTAIHWSTGADPKHGERWLDTLGGWFNAEPKVGFSKYGVRTSKLKQVEPTHPICRGWKEFLLREEYYYLLKFRPDIKTILEAEIDKTVYPVAWVYERPDSKHGRSFGHVGGHFHDNFGIKEFRQAIVNGILWTAHLEVPANGAPVNITDKDLVLPAKEIPPRKGTSETIKLFDGASLEGWEGYQDLWSVKEGVIVARNDKPLKYSTYLLTKRKFTDFRLTFAAKLVESEMHSGVAFWGEVYPKADGKVQDAKTDRTEHTYKGHLVMFPSGWGMYDLFGRNGLPVSGAPAKKVGKQHDWNDIEILAQGNRVRVAVKGHAVVDWRDPEPQRIKEGPIGLQLHSNKIPQEVHFKGLVLETFPKEDRLITVK